MKLSGMSKLRKKIERQSTVRVEFARLFYDRNRAICAAQLTVCNWPAVPFRREAATDSFPLVKRRAPRASDRHPAVVPRLAKLHLRLLRHLECVVNLDSEVSHRALEFGVAEQELHSPEVLGATVDKGRLGPPPMPLSA